MSEFASPSDGPGYVHARVCVSGFTSLGVGSFCPYTGVLCGAPDVNQQPAPLMRRQHAGECVCWRGGGVGCGARDTISFPPGFKVVPTASPAWWVPFQRWEASGNIPPRPRPFTEPKVPASAQVGPCPPTHVSVCCQRCRGTDREKMSRAEEQLELTAVFQGWPHN